MDITRYVDLLQRELAVAAEAGGDEARALADRLTAPLESAIRLALLEALSDAAAEITRDLAPGSVHLRLRGRDPDFVVSSAPTGQVLEDAAPVVFAAPPDDTAAPGGDKGGSSRINLRLPDDLKARVEEAAGRERLSVNGWLVRAAAAALESGPGPGHGPGDAGHRGSSGGQRFTGWAR
jgi:hypothetical protein